jgi:hypothetical protein
MAWLVLLDIGYLGLLGLLRMGCVCIDRDGKRRDKNIDRVRRELLRL